MTLFRINVRLKVKKYELWLVFDHQWFQFLNVALVVCMLKVAPACFAIKLATAMNNTPLSLNKGDKNVTLFTNEHVLTVASSSLRSDMLVYGKTGIVSEISQAVATLAWRRLHADIV